MIRFARLPPVLVLSALAAARAAPARAERLAVKSYTTANGLAHDSVHAISQDRHGFLWFGTAEGLSRFDGYRFTTVGREQGLPNPFVTGIVEDTDGGRWVATRGGGVVHLTRTGQPGRVHLFEGGPRANWVVFLYRDRRGRLWAGAGGGVHRLRSPEAGFERIGPGPPGTVPIRSAAEAKDGTLWLSSVQGLMAWRDGGSIDTRAGLGFDEARTAQDGPLAADEAGRLWLGGPRGLFALLPPATRVGPRGTREPCRVVLRTGHPVRRPATPGEVCRYVDESGRDYKATAFLRLRDGSLAVATDGQGLLALGELGFRRYTTASGLIDDTVLSLFEDRDENLWAGTPSGVMRLQRGGFESYGPADGLVDPHIVSLVAGRDGRLCALGTRGVLQCLRGERLQAVRPRVPPNWAEFGVDQLLLQDRQGAWWVRTPTGLYRFPPGDALAALTRSPRRFGKESGLPADRPSRVFEDSRGDLWVGVQGEGENTLARRPAEASAFTAIAVPTSEQSPRQLPTAFADDGRGTVWIGFRTGSLARYRQGRLEMVDGPRVRPGVVAEYRSFHVDARGRLWFAAEQDGLGRIDHPEAERPQIARYGRREGLASDHVRCVTSDEWGRIYVGTQQGVDRLDPESGLVRHFTPDDGLARGTVEVCARAQGRLWFGTASGLSSYQPRREAGAEAPPVFIQGLQVAGEPHAPASSGETEVGEIGLAFPGRIQIEFTSIAFRPGRGVRYQYRLQGADGDWSPLTDDRSVTFAGLNPGRYRFEVRAVSAEGLASPAPASVRFRVVPPWWRRPWFLALALTLFVAAVAAAVRYRVAMLLRIERLRTRIASDLHDDVGSTVSRMAILSEVARRQVEATHAEAARVLEEIGASARGLLDTTGDIVWAIDPGRDDGGSLAARVREFGAGLLEAKGIAWEFTASREVEALRFDADQRRQLLLVFKEALHNIVRHAHCSAAAVEITAGDGRVRAEVRDDGRGFAVDGRPDRGHGLDSMRARVARLGGELGIHSQPGAGTRLTIDVPLHRRSA